MILCTLWKLPISKSQTGHLRFPLHRADSHKTSMHLEGNYIPWNGTTYKVLCKYANFLNWAVSQRVVILGNVWLSLMGTIIVYHQLSQQRCHFSGLNLTFFPPNLKCMVLSLVCQTTWTISQEFITFSVFCNEISGISEPSTVIVMSV